MRTLLASLALVSPLLGQPLSPTATSTPQEWVVRAEIVSTPFSKFLKYENYRVTTLDGAEHTGGFVYGPGHHISAMAALVFAPDGTPYCTFKTGDTRLSRALRGEPYVATSAIAGRWDKEGYSAGKIVLAELSEEVGGEVDLKVQKEPSPSEITIEGEEKLPMRGVETLPAPSWTALEALSAGLPGQAESLAPRSAASSGQADLFYHYVACRIEPPQNQLDFATLSQAIQMCRDGNGDAQTESTLLRLSDHLEWIPQLAMSRADARRLLEKR